MAKGNERRTGGEGRWGILPSLGTRYGVAFTDDTLLVWEWFAVVRRL
jgi:hypothetical protein